MESTTRLVKQQLKFILNILLWFLVFEGVVFVAEALSKFESYERTGAGYVNATLVAYF